MPYVDSVKRRVLARTVRTDAGCLEWRGTLNSAGYGRSWFKGVQITTHRLSWLLYRGPIPDGLLVLHRCDNKPCVNPDHLFLGTHSDNIRDAYSKGRRPRGTRAGISRKLTKDQAQEIRTSDERITHLARRFGINPSYACRIKKGTALKGGTVAVC